MHRLVVHLDDEAASVARFGPVLYVVWRKPETPIAVPHMDAAADAILSQYGGGRNLLYVHRTPNMPSVALHSDETYEAVMAHFDRTERHSRAAGLGLEVSGFIGAAVRAMVAGVLLARRSEVKTKAFRDARLAVRWLAQQTSIDAPFDPDALIDQLRGHELCRVVGFEQDFR
ncbi:MAG: hypothetical protein AB8I08_36645 [Sandaracinaceae bacterium]